MMTKISKLMLGTAQLGGKYGIANILGMQSKQDTCGLIKHALFLGVDSFDTAPQYGESEAIIGESLKGADQLHISRIPMIVTKIPSVQSLGLATEEERKRFVHSSIESSLKKLNRSELDICLLHDPKDMVYQNGEIINLLLDLKGRNTIKKIGVSVYDQHDIDLCLELGCFESIQIPINVFDQRLLRNGMLQKLTAKGIEVFARSIYLQGLLLMDPENLPDQFNQAKTTLDLLSGLCQDAMLTKKELSLLFVRDLPGISKIIIGCETKDQLIENITMMELPPLKKEIAQRVCDLFRDIPIEIIDPRMWK
jgi:aryl-alcohol dehydrogenase-like predicted oxidoreductase